MKRIETWTAKQLAKSYEVGDTAESFFEYLCESLDNGNFSQYRELFSEMSFSDREREIRLMAPYDETLQRKRVHALFVLSLKILILSGGDFYCQPKYKDYE